MVKPVRLHNGRSWTTQKDAKAHFKAILNRYNDGQRIDDPSDYADLAALVAIYDHPEGAKVGVGIDHFFRDRDQEHNGLTSCFYIRRADGTAVDFSYLRAVEVASRVAK